MRTATQDALAAMPDDARTEDISNRLYVLEQVRAGLEELDADRGLTNNEVRASLAR